MILEQHQAPSAPAAGNTKRRPRRGWRFVVLALLAAAVVAVVVRATLVDFYYVASGSMEPTLVPGDGLLVDRTAYGAEGPRRGDVVVFDGRGSFLAYQRPSAADRFLRALRLAGDDTIFVKRVVAVEGDTLSCCGPDGSLTLNGAALPEPYVMDGDRPSVQRFEVTVPAGRLWVMGDHRSVSTDSRALLGAPGGGMVPVDRVVGRVEHTVWPLDRTGPVGTEDGQ
jgi:signal peptidase I